MEVSLVNSCTMSSTSKAVPHLGCLAQLCGNCSTDCLFFCEGATFDVLYWIIDAFAFLVVSGKLHETFTRKSDLECVTSQN